MKPAAFAYQAPTTEEAAVGLLGEHGTDARVLAGGQSLLIELRYRQRQPRLLVDINRIASLSGLAVDGARLRLGALARQAELERAAFDDPLARLLGDVARYVAHPPIRALGTFAGSLAWAHPAAEWGALAVAVEAEVSVVGRSGARTVTADRWYRGPFRTDLRPDEMVTEVWLPLLGAGTAVRFAELRRTNASFPLVAVAVAVRAADGRVEQARIGMAGVADIPLRAPRAEEALVGHQPSWATVRAAAELAAAEADPVPEPHCSVPYRRHALAVLVRRCLTEALRETVT